MLLSQRHRFETDTSVPTTESNNARAGASRVRARSTDSDGLPVYAAPAQHMMQLLPQMPTAAPPNFWLAPQRAAPSLFQMPQSAPALADLLRIARTQSAHEMAPKRARQDSDASTEERPAKISRAHVAHAGPATAQAPREADSAAAALTHRASSLSSSSSHSAYSGSARPLSPKTTPSPALSAAQVQRLPLRRVSYPFWSRAIRSSLQTPLDEMQREALCAQVVATLDDALASQGGSVQLCAQELDPGCAPMHVKREGAKFFPRKNRTSRFVHHSFRCAFQASFAAAVYRTTFGKGGAVGMPNMCELYMPRRGPCLVQLDYEEVGVEGDTAQPRPSDLAQKLDMMLQHGRVT